MKKKKYVVFLTNWVGLAYIVLSLIGVSFGVLIVVGNPTIAPNVIGATTLLTLGMLALKDGLNEKAYTEVEVEEKLCN